MGGGGLSTSRGEREACEGKESSGVNQVLVCLPNEAGVLLRQFHAKIYGEGFGGEGAIRRKKVISNLLVRAEEMKK